MKVDEATIITPIQLFKPSAPDEYWALSLENQLGNGCGPDLVQQGVLRHYIGHNSFFKLSCGVHNYQYSTDDKTPASEDHRLLADDIFLQNMLAECALVKSRRLRYLRIAHAYLFYGLCRLFGRRFYKKGA